MKELPKVYVNPIEKNLQNNKDLFYSRLMSDRKGTKDVMREIDYIFHSKDFVYKSRVEITTHEGIIETTLIGKTQTSLLTMDGKRIPITEIEDIKKVG